MTGKTNKVKIGWLADNQSFIGGGELVQRDLLAQTPDDFEIIPCPPTAPLPQGVDLYVVHGCNQYGWDIIEQIKKPVLVQLHDKWRYVDFDLRNWFCHNADMMIFSSPLHLKTVEFGVFCPTVILPVGMDLAPFQAVKDNVWAKMRNVACWVGRFDEGKGVLSTIEWAKENAINIDYYGYGDLITEVQKTGRYRRQLEASEVALTLAGYEDFIFLPTEVEPFGRTVVEAWAAGCELIVNGNVGAMYWIEQEPEKLTQGIELFWGQVRAVLG